MSILEHQPEPERSGRGGLVILIGLLLVAGGIAAYLWMPGLSESTPERAATDPPRRAVAPAPEPVPEPEPSTPEPEPEPDPTPLADPEPVPAAPDPVALPLLRVTSDVAGASVFLNREFLGTTPLESSDVPTGMHRLNVSAEGHEGFARDVELGSELVSVDVRFLQIRLDTRVTVIHKHRFGSCQGILRADLDGIHYETSDDDAFSLPLSQIEEHEVDYLEHTLTVKERDGRTYNFTDEQETADALFVFHREVEQIRDRLAARR